jgi:hypothetical protein
MRLTHVSQSFTSRRAVLALSLTQDRVVYRKRVQRLMCLKNGLVRLKEAAPYRTRLNPQ